MNRSLRLLLSILFVPAAAVAGETRGCPLATESSGPHDCPFTGGPGASAHRHAGDAAGREESGMGFSQTATTHHFLLAADGGSIEVTAHDVGDGATRDRIRMHLTHVREMFSAGDFSVPMFVHDTVPPGVSTMKRRAAAIRCLYEDLAGGGRIRLSTADPDARDAIHDFLRFQIREHGTGDPTATR